MTRQCATIYHFYKHPLSSSYSHPVNGFPCQLENGCACSVKIQRLFVRRGLAPSCKHSAKIQKTVTCPHAEAMKRGLTSNQHPSGSHHGHIHRQPSLHSARKAKCDGGTAGCLVLVARLPVIGIQPLSISSLATCLRRVAEPFAFCRISEWSSLSCCIPRERVCAAMAQSVSPRMSSVFAGAESSLDAVMRAPSTTAPDVVVLDSVREEVKPRELIDPRKWQRFPRETQRFFAANPDLAMLIMREMVLRREEDGSGGSLPPMDPPVARLVPVEEDMSDVFVQVPRRRRDARLY